MNKFLAVFILALLVSARAGASDFSGEISGTDMAFSLRANITPSAGAGSPCKTFVGALIPNGIGWFFLTPTGYQAWAGGDIPAYSSEILAPVSAQVLNQMDVTPFIGTQIYVGYGASAEGMLANGTYSLLYTVGETFVPYGIRVMGSNQLSPGCHAADQCWNGTARVLKTPFREGSREVVIAVFRGATGLYNLLPAYADALSSISVTGGRPASFDWVVSDDTGFLVSGNGRCARILFVPPAGIIPQLASCP